jgi:uncharacterized SAM-dependent methyltransferase
MNRELEADFAVSQFVHRAFYNAPEGRIEMHLVSRRAQWVQIGEAAFFIARGESVRTELSYKYQIDDLGKLAEAAGLTLKESWTDDSRYFSVLYFEIDRST